MSDTIAESRPDHWFRHVRCTNRACPEPADTYITLPVVAPGVLGLPAFTCAGCGFIVLEIQDAAADDVTEKDATSGLHVVEARDGWAINCPLTEPEPAPELGRVYYDRDDAMQSAGAHHRTRHAGAAAPSDELGAPDLAVHWTAEPGTVVIPIGPGQIPWMRIYQQGGYDGWVSATGQRTPCGGPDSPQNGSAITLFDPATVHPLPTDIEQACLRLSSEGS